MNYLIRNKAENLLKKGVSIIVVTYNSYNEIDGLWDSLKAAQDPNINFEIIFIDNNSSDKTQRKLAELSQENSNIKVILNDSNIGLAAANNQAITQIKNEFTLILNPDIIVKNNTITNLIEYLTNNNAVIAVAPINIDGEGNKHSSFHKNWSIFHVILWRILPISLTKWIYSKIRRYDKEQTVLFASGSCLMMRSNDYINIGGYDPVYFLTVEDVCDLCMRLKEKTPGSVIRVIPQAEVIHLISRSAKNVPLITQWEGIKGSIYHFKKHKGIIYAALVTGVLLTSILIRTIFTLVKMPFSYQKSKTKLSQNMILIKRIITKNPILNIKDNIK